MDEAVVTAPVLPPDGARVRLVLRDGRTIFGDIIPARLQSGRWPLKAWGLDQKTMCIAPAEVEEVDIVALSPEQIREIAARQRVELDPRGMPAKRATMVMKKEQGR